LVNKIANFQSLLPLRSPIPLVIVQALLAKARVLETSFPVSGGIRNRRLLVLFFAPTIRMYLAVSASRCLLRVEIQGDAD